MMTNSMIDNSSSYNVKAAFKHACHYQDKFEHAICSLTISVGQAAHEGDKLAATINIVNNQFRECIIMVCDSLQRYSIAAHTKKSIAELHDQANILGEQWIARNEKIINKLTISHQIIRWDSWLNHSLFADARRVINDLYLSDVVFKKFINDTAENFVKRDKKRFFGVDYDCNKVFNTSVLYLKEECAGMLLWVEKNINFEIYPRHRNEAMEYVHKLLILPKYSNMLMPLSIRLKDSIE